MAKYELNNPLNLQGALFVDTTCIDCGTCFHLSPEVFKEENDQSVVIKQPESMKQWEEAKRAILSCPTNSIGVKNAPPEFKAARENLPYLITDEVYYCGYTSRDSFGATSYFIKRSEGNILVDSPRFHPQLVKKLEALGGIEWMFLSHQDDVADHAKFADYFGCKRIIHERDVESSTSSCEMILRDEIDFQLDKDLQILFTPGHTRGHLNLLYKEEFLFTGDHLFYSLEDHHLYASQNVNWYSWKEQLKSLEKLLTYHFRWVLPGHGGWITKSNEELKNEIRIILKKGQV